jgi:hypothetical protein
MEDSFNNQINSATGGDPATPYVPVDPRASLARKLSLIFLAFSLVLSGVTSVTLLNSKVDEYAADSGTDYYDDTSVAADSYDDSWMPYGFNSWPDDYSLAYKYSEVSDYDCEDYNCTEISFVSQYDCPANFYAAANYLDGPDGNVIGYDNASLPSIQAGQIAKFIFEDTSNTSFNWQIAEISCY